MPVISAFGRPRRADHLRSGVWDQPSQHGETPSLLKNTKMSRVVVVCACKPSYLGGWGRRTAWTWEAEVAVRQDHTTALQHGWQSKTLKKTKKNAIDYNQQIHKITIHSLTVLDTWDTKSQNILCPQTQVQGQREEDDGLTELDKWAQLFIMEVVAGVCMSYSGGMQKGAISSM